MLYIIFFSSYRACCYRIIICSENRPIYWYRIYHCFALNITKFHQLYPQNISFKLSLNSQVDNALEFQWCLKIVFCWVPAYNTGAKPSCIVTNVSIQYCSKTPLVVYWMKICFRAVTGSLLYLFTYI